MASVPDLFLDNAGRRNTHAVRREAGDSKSGRHPLIYIMAFVAFVALAGITTGIQRLTEPGALPIREIRVAGEFHHLRPAQIQSLVTKSIDGGFFSVNVNAIRKRLLLDPWIKKASIRRIWPGGLQVTITEQDPAARWGEQALLNGDGMLFEPAADTPDLALVQLSGPPGSEHAVLQQYRNFSRLFTGVGLTVTGLSLSNRSAWVVHTAQGHKIVLGRKAVDSRVDQFLKAYAATRKADWKQIDVIDLRYTNGFAVHQREQLAMEPGESGESADMAQRGLR